MSQDLKERRRAIFAAYSECLVSGLCMTPDEIADKLLRASNPAPVEQAAPVTVPNGWQQVALPDGWVSVFESMVRWARKAAPDAEKERIDLFYQHVCARPLAAAPAAPSADAQYKQQRDRLLDFIKRAPVSSGVCCCGDEMANHASPMTCGHSPVDQWDNSVSCIVREIEEADTALPAQKENGNEQT